MRSLACVIKLLRLFLVAPCVGLSQWSIFLQQEYEPYSLYRSLPQFFFANITWVSESFIAFFLSVAFHYISYRSTSLS